MTDGGPLTSDQLDQVLDPLGAAVVTIAATGEVTYASPALAALIGEPARALEGRSLVDFLHPDDIDYTIGALARWDGREAAVTGPRTRLRTSAGEWLDVLVDIIAGPQVEAFGAIVGVVRPRTAEEELRQELRQHLHHEDRLARLTSQFVGRQGEAFDDAVAGALTELGSMEYVTRAAVYHGDAADLALVAQWEAPANAPTVPLAPRRAVAGHALLERLAAGEVVSIDSVDLMDDDLADERDELARAAVQSFLAVPMVSHGRFIGFVSLEVSIGEADLSGPQHRALTTTAAVLAEAFSRRELEDALTHRAVHDPVTGLANHARFLEVLGSRIHPSRRAVDGPGLAVALIDLDGFKLVNDALGHAVGDQLLCHAADRLSGAVPGGALLARLGGDDFACLLVDHDPEAAETAVTALVDAVEGPARIGDHDLRVRARAGLVHEHEVAAGRRSGGAGGPTAMLTAAEAALRRAVASPGARVARFDASLGEQIDRRSWIEADLPLALEREELALHYQPEVDLVEGTVVGAEALLRWHHPRKGLLAAGAFVGDAEHSAVFPAVSDWVLAAACRQLAAWGPDGPHTMRVNLSGRDISRPGVAERLGAVLGATGVDAARLCVEITETAVLTDPDQARSSCEALRALGVQIAVDDFGTGHWSMRSLTQLPIDVLKIDRALVDGIDRSPSAPGIVSAVLVMAARLGLEVVAEGVERPEELAVLRELGCSRAQGYLFARPTPASEWPPAIEQIGVGR